MSGSVLPAFALPPPQLLVIESGTPDWQRVRLESDAVDSPKSPHGSCKASPRQDSCPASPRRDPCAASQLPPLAVAPALVVTALRTPFTMQHVNPSWVRLCGYTPTEAVGGTLELLQGPLTSDAQLQKLQQAISGLSRTSVRLTIYAKSGEPSLITLHVEPVSAEYDSNLLTHFVGRLIPEADGDSDSDSDSGQLSPSWLPHSPRFFPASSPLSTPREAYPDEAIARLMLLFAMQLAVVKTVKNDDWLALANRLALGEAFRSSVSLPPPHGVGMSLFGRVSSGAAGLAWHRKALDLDNAFMWPPGYYAKTEYNLITDKKGKVVLVGGREEARVSLEALLEINEEHSRACDSAPGTPPLSYNELSLMIKGGRGLVGVFARSARVEHLLFALGVRSLLEHCLPRLHPLPLLLLTTSGGAAPLARAEQLRLLRGVASRELSVLEQMEPRLPINSAAFPELSAHEQLLLHARHGITSKSLSALFHKLSRKGHDIGALRACLSYALAIAIEHNNPPSAREVVRAGSPLMLAAMQPCVEEGDLDNAFVAFTQPTPPRRYAELGELSIPSDASDNGDADEGDSAHEALGGSRQAGGDLSVACPPIKTITPSQDLLVALGAKITLNEFVAGRTTARLSNACQQLADWLLQAQRPWCGSLLFLLRSWQETKQVEPGSDLLTFLGGKAVANRRKFHEALSRLREARDGLSYMTVLYSLVSELRRPCLRLRVLQQVLGLDCRFSRDIVFGVVCLAYDVVESLDAPEDCVGPLGTTDCTRVVNRVSLDGYDEAVELEADIMLGPRRFRRRPIDPIGHERRQYRVYSGARH